jgi:hypothetical protein
VLVTHTLQHESVMPTTLVPGFLYLGNYDTASRQEILKAFNITHVLNVSSAGTAAGSSRYTCQPRKGCLIPAPTHHMHQQPWIVHPGSWIVTTHRPR